MSTNDDETSEPSLRVTVEQAREAIRTLIDAFDTLTNAGAVNPQAADERLFTDVFGWWAWINNSSKLVLLAYDAGLGHEASPSVRSILEHAVVMQWVIDDREPATAAIAAKAADNRRKLFDDATAQGWAIPDDITRPEPTRQTMPDFASLCARYDAKILYIPYRMLSAHVHPSAKGAETYVDRETLELHTHADKNTRSDLVLVAICLLQTAQAINALTSDRPLTAAIAAANAPFGNSIEPFQRR
jgi:hypothetical protein